MNTDEIIVRLLRVERLYWLWVDKHEKAGIEVIDEPLQNFEVLMLALDLLGVPPDSEEETEDAFCRDFFYMIFEICLVRHDDPKTFMAIARQQLEVPDLDEAEIEQHLYPESATKLTNN